MVTEMDQEDGLIWVYGPDDMSVMAFTDFGIEMLAGLVDIYKAGPDHQNGLPTRNDATTPTRHANEQAPGRARGVHPTAGNPRLSLRAIRLLRDGRIGE